MNAAHVAIDGSTVVFDAELDFSLQPVSVLELRVSDWTYEFTAGAPELGRWAAEQVSGIPLTERYSLQGGRLLVGRGTAVGADGAVAPVMAGVWEGRKASMVAMYPRSDDPQNVVTLFSGLAISERGRSIVLRPNRGTIEREPSIAWRVPDFGIIEVFPITPRTARMIPGWAGTRVRGGELFRGETRGQAYYVLAARSAVAVTVPQHGVGPDRVAAGLETLAVTWTAP